MNTSKYVTSKLTKHYIDRLAEHIVLETDAMCSLCANAPCNNQPPCLACREGVKAWLTERFEQLCKNVSEELYVKTPKGNLVVSVNDPHFPGVSVDIEKEGDLIAVATVESDTDNDGKITIWGFADADSDEYTHQIVIRGLD